jgi:hypothetical protein
MRRTPLLVALAATAAATAAAAAPSPATAAGGVYGGTTSAGEAIVLNTDRAGRRIRSAVLSWVARCDDGSRYPIGVRVTATTAQPGFVPGPRDLVMSRNRKQRFAGAFTAGHDLGDHIGLVSAELRGRLRAGRASGTLEGEATVVDLATGTAVTSCTTGLVRWRATRAPGRVYGGSTGQGQPFVARLDSRGRRVQDLYFGWNSEHCVPEGFIRFGESFANFALDRRGRWGDSWAEVVELDSGGQATFEYTLEGTLGRTGGRGALEIDFERTDAAGVTDTTCHSGRVTWKAATG